MGQETLSEMLKETPVICAVKSPDDLANSLTCESKVVFVLFGDVISIAGIVAKINAAGKLAFVHIDLIEGLAPRDVSVDYLAGSTQVDGIISTKTSIVRRAKALGLFAVQRFFVLDSMAILNIEKQIPFDHIDAIEILPGAMPKIIKTIAGFTHKPIIASGLVNDKDDVIGALGAGATSVSSSKSAVWFM